MSVSVIMSTFNRERYIASAVESVLKQSHRAFELIVVDDASTDGTPDILARLAARDGRLRVVRNAANQGLPAGRNLCLSLARHDLVACMDDDDLMLTDRLARQLAFMRAHPEVSVVSAAARLIDDAENVIGLSVPEINLARGRAEVRPALFLGLIHPAVMYRKQDVLRVGGYRPVALEDRDLWGRMVTAGYVLAAQPDVLLLHRRHASIMQGDLDALFEQGEFIDFNVARRLRGLEDLSLAAYRRAVAAQPLLQRFSRRRRMRAGIAFRKATLFYSRREWRPFLMHIAAAMSLEPIQVCQRIAKKYSPGR